jgi:hypothetical protein
MNRETRTPPGPRYPDDGLPGIGMVAEAANALPGTLPRRNRWEALDRIHQDGLRIQNHIRELGDHGVTAWMFAQSACAAKPRCATRYSSCRRFKSSSKT